MITLAAGGSWAQYVGPLRDREPFLTNGTLSGGPGVPASLGLLRDDWIASAKTADYVVCSGPVPIAWHTPDGEWVIPDLSLTPAAARHQSRIAVAITALRHGA